MTKRIESSEEEFFFKYYKYPPYAQEDRENYHLNEKDLRRFKKTKIDVLEIKNMISEMKNMPHGTNSILDIVEGKITELENIAIRTSKMKQMQKINYRKYS